MESSSLDVRDKAAPAGSQIIVYIMFYSFIVRLKLHFQMFLY